MANPAIERLTEEYRSSGPTSSAVVTIDSVVQKTAATLGVLMVFAIGTWAFVNQVLESGNSDTFSKVAAITFVVSLATFGLSLFISFKQVTSPALILLFAAMEGVVLGFLSKSIALYTGTNEPVYGAVLGTFVTAAATLAVYKFFNIQVTNRMRKIVTIAVFAFIGVSLVNLVFSFAGAGLGVNGLGATGFIFSLIGLGIALFMLIIDFDAVERAIEYRLPEKQSWALAFGLTVTLVWIYVNLLKILAILTGRD